MRFSARQQSLARPMHASEQIKRSNEVTKSMSVELTIRDPTPLPFTRRHVTESIKSA